MRTLALLLVLPTLALADVLQGRIVGVHDGDTLTLLAPGNVQHKVRLEGIDAPELGLSYRATVALASQSVEAGGARHRLAPGMQVSAEINLGERTVLEYLLSPVQKTLHEAGRER